MQTLSHNMLYYQDPAGILDNNVIDTQQLHLEETQRIANLPQWALGFTDNDTEVNVKWKTQEDPLYKFLVANNIVTLFQSPFKSLHFLGRIFLLASSIERIKKHVLVALKEGSTSVGKRDVFFM
jgi:hypothetical protein